MNEDSPGGWAMLALLRRWGWVGVALLTAALVTAVVLLQAERSATSAELASLSDRMAERDAEAEELAERADAVDELSDELEAALSEIERLETENTELEAEVAAVQEEAEQAVADAAATSAPPEPAPAAPAEPSAPDPCDQLGMGHEQGSDWCAGVLQRMEECQQRIDSDPNWVHLDGGLYEHVETGEVTTCDI